MNLSGFCHAEIAVALALLATVSTVGAISALGAAAGSHDPSLRPAFDDRGNAVERYRLRVDFDGDGELDLALSTPIGLFGQSGGMFVLYRAIGAGEFARFGEVHLSPRAISLERLSFGVRLWTYSRASGSEGRLGHYEIRSQVGTSPEVSVGDFESITIAPGDGGTELGGDLYRTAFAKQHRVQVERSSTVNGQVRWQPWP